LTVIIAMTIVVGASGALAAWERKFRQYWARNSCGRAVGI